MKQATPNAAGTIFVILIIAAVIGFIALMVHGWKKGAKQGREFREKVSRQNQELRTMVKNANADSSDQLRKLKSLLDDGVITQSEYEAKKKQILGI